MGAVARFFKLEAAGTTVATEARAGVVTFMTMAYIIVVQPIILKGAGMPLDAVMLATCLSSALATLMMGLLANYPIALAPAMGHNIYFAILVTTKVVPDWRVALGAVFLSGSLFMFLSLFGFRERIINAVPDSLKYAIAVGIGLLIALLGFRHAGLVVDTPDARAWTLGRFGAPAVLAVVGLALTGTLMAFKLRGAILVGLVATTVAGMVMGLVQPAPSPIEAPPWSALAQTAFQLDIAGVFRLAGLGAFGVIFTFFFLDLFDTIGTLIGVSQQAGLMVEGKLPRAREALFSDATGTVAGALLGTSTVTSYIESAAGVSEGGRTGLANMVTAGLFILAIFFLPLVRMVAGGVPVQQTFRFEEENLTASWAPEAQPAAGWAVREPQAGTVTVSRTDWLYPVTAPTLIIIGCLMMSMVARVPWGDWTEALPAFLAILMMPLTMNITEGIAFGFISYSLLKAVTGRVREVSPWVLVFAGLFVARYAWLMS